MGETIKLTQEQKHEHRECLCYHCNNLQESKEQIEKFTISNRKGKSYFADEMFTIQLCERCVQDLEIEDEWFDNEICFDETSGYYHYEPYILGMVETFPVANQEYIFNCYNSNFCSHVDEKRVSREDWIKDNS